MYKLPASIDEARALQSSAEQMQLSAKAQERLACIAYFVERGHSVTDTCRHFGITRSTLYRIIDRFDPQNLESLEDRSRKPKNVRTSSLSEHAKQLIRSYRHTHPHAGKDTIAQLLQVEHGIHVSGSAVARLIQSEGLYFGDSLMHQKRRIELHADEPDDIAPSFVDEQSETVEVQSAVHTLTETEEIRGEDVQPVAHRLPDSPPLPEALSPPPEPPDTGQRVPAPPGPTTYINRRFIRASSLALIACIALLSIAGSRQVKPADDLHGSAPVSNTQTQEHHDTPLLEACRGVLAEYEIVNRWREEYGTVHTLTDREQAEIDGCQKIVDTATPPSVTPPSVPPSVSLSDGR